MTQPQNTNTKFTVLNSAIDLSGAILTVDKR